MQVEGEPDPAEDIGEQVQTVVEGAQNEAAAAIAAANARADEAAQTAEQIADAARESAIVRELQQHREDMDTWRAGLENRVAATEQTVASLPETFNQTLSAQMEQMRLSLLASIQPQTSTPAATDPAQADPAQADPLETAPAAAGPRESPASNDPPPKPKRRHVL